MVPDKARTLNSEFKVKTELTVGVVARSSLDSNLGDGADDGAVGAPLTDQIHDPVCDLLDERRAPPPVLRRLKHSAGKHHYGLSVCEVQSK